MKTIIIYTTKYGFSRVLAEHLQEKLAGEIHLADAKGPVPGLEPYDTVILGGSVYMGRIQKAMTAYIREHLQELLGKNIGLYLSAGITDGAVEEQELRAAFGTELINHAAAKDVLGYCFDFSKMNFLERCMVKAKGKGTENERVLREERMEQFVHMLSGRK